jgi:DNA-binding CsgD family transcriptional regulator
LPCDEYATLDAARRQSRQRHHSASRFDENGNLQRLSAPVRHYYGINLFAFDGRNNTGDIRIWRKNGHPDFDRDEVGLLSLIAPGFARALKRIEVRAQPKTRATPTSSRLSPREAEVAELAAHGLADKEIARRLNPKFATVRTHLDNAFSKLGVRNRTQLVASLCGSDRADSHD